MNDSTLTNTLRSHFTVLYQRQRLFGKSQKTVRLYHFTFNYLDAFLGREAVLDDLTDETVMQLMEWIVGERELSTRTANKARDQLCALWGFLARKTLVKTWPDVPKLPEPERTPVAWSERELGLLWEMLAAQGGFISFHRIPAAQYWLALHSVAYDTLERIGAVRQLKWSDLRQSEHLWVHFRAETRKGRKKENTSKLDATTAALLQSIRQPDRELIFPWDQHQTYFWTKYRTMRERAGLPSDPKHSFHCIRRTGASFAEAAGADASRLLGHSSRAVTERSYLDPLVCIRQQAVDFLRRPDSTDPPRAA